MIVFELIESIIKEDTQSIYREHFHMEEDDILPIRGIFTTFEGCLILSDVGTIHQDYFYYSNPERKIFALETTHNIENLKKLQKWLAQHETQFREILSPIKGLDLTILSDIQAFKLDD